MAHSSEIDPLEEITMPDSGLSVAHINLARGYRGGERQTQLLVEGLSAAGWRQKLVARRGELLAQRCAAIDGLELVEVPARVLSSRPTPGTSQLSSRLPRTGVSTGG